MDLTPELLGTAAVGLLVILGAIGNYLRALKRGPPDPMLSGVGGGLVDRDQMERLIAAVNRLGDIMADKNAAGINDRLDDLVDKIDHMVSPHRKR